MPEERHTSPACSAASALARRVLLTGVLVGGPFIMPAAHATDGLEHPSALSLGQGLRIAPSQRSVRSMSTSDLPDPTGSPGVRHANSIGDAGGPLGLSLWRGSNWFSGDRLSLNLSGNTRGADGLRLREDNTNSALVGLSSPAQGWRSGNLSLTSELLYSTPIGRHLGLGLSIMQRSSGLRDTSVADERVLSLRFSGQF